MSQPYFYSHFIDKEIEAQRGLKTFFKITHLISGRRMFKINQPYSKDQLSWSLLWKCSTVFSSLDLAYLRGKWFPGLFFSLPFCACACIHIWINIYLYKYNTLFYLWKHSFLPLIHLIKIKNIKFLDVTFIICFSHISFYIQL